MKNFISILCGEGDHIWSLGEHGKNITTLDLYQLIVW
jgi:hypothetical protein